MSSPPDDPPAATGPGHARARAVLLGIGVLALFGTAGVLAWRLRPDREPSPESDKPSFPLTPISSSPYRNTTAEARYVGSETCRDCHPGETDSFRDTGMGRSLAPVVAGNEPPDGGVDHMLSGVRCETYRKDGQFRHRQLLLTGDKERLVLSDFPVKYVVGSGRHAKTYLVETDGFLVESPVTWFRARGWDMSPGYDKPGQLGFEREVTQGCLMCHAGRTEEIDRSPHRIRFHEEAIGCERCHGPGSLHVERTTKMHSKKLSADAIDDTIVNPRKLPRHLAEAVCEQCHLLGTAVVPMRGRRFEDYRPGLPVQDFRLDYVIRQPDAPLSVTGQVEQLHLSRCYQKSSDLTCLNCHDPHGFPSKGESVAYYRAACQKCHENRKPCKDPAALDAKNGCVKCHMPTGKTEVPHVAFTNHRIGLYPDPRHPETTTPAAPTPDQIEPVHDLSRLSDVDRDRGLAIACLQLSSLQKNPRARDQFRLRGIALLHRAEVAGLDDAIVDSAETRLSFGQDPARVIKMARKSLSHPDLPSVDRCDTMIILADAYYRSGKYNDALAVLREVTSLRRNAGYWVLIARCYEVYQRDDEAIHALEQALAIDPMLAQVRRRLAQYYADRGDREKAEYHRRRAGG